MQCCGHGNWTHVSSGMLIVTRVECCLRELNWCVEWNVVTGVECCDRSGMLLPEWIGMLLPGTELMCRVECYDQERNWCVEWNVVIRNGTDVSSGMLWPGTELMYRVECCDQERNWSVEWNVVTGRLHWCIEWNVMTSNGTDVSSGMLWPETEQVSSGMLWPETEQVSSEMLWLGIELMCRVECHSDPEPNWCVEWNVVTGNWTSVEWNVVTGNWTSVEWNVVTGNWTDVSSGMSQWPGTELMCRVECCDRELNWCTVCRQRKLDHHALKLYQHFLLLWKLHVSNNTFDKIYTYIYIWLSTRS